MCGCEEGAEKSGMGCCFGKVLKYDWKDDKYQERIFESLLIVFNHRCDPSFLKIQCFSSTKIKTMTMTIFVHSILLFAKDMGSYLSVKQVL